MEVLKTDDTPNRVVFGIADQSTQKDGFWVLAYG